MNATGQNTQTDVKAEVVTEKKKPSTLVDTLFDIGLSWADFGVGQGKRALEQSAKTLEKVAASLADFQAKLKNDRTA
jgi:hypothetical protein